MRSPDGRRRGWAAAATALLLVVPAVHAHAASRRAATLTLGSSAAAFSYLGAWSAPPLDVRLAPEGTASFHVRRTGQAAMTVLSNGASFEATVDGTTSPKVSLPDCGCWRTITVAGGLGPGQHAITVTNIDPTRSFPIRSWQVDAQGSFLQFYWSHPELATVLPQNHSTTFTVRNTASISIGYLANGVRVRVGIDDQYLAYVFTGPTGGAVAHRVIGWGLTSGFEKVTLTATHGTLDLRTVSLLQAAGRGIPSVVNGATIGATPLLGVFADSIGSGLRTLGPVRDSDGFAERLAAIRGWRVTQRGLGGASAGCWGTTYANRIVNAHPDVVIVAFGTNDMIPGADFYGCDDTLAQFRSAVESILGTVGSGLPGVPVFVEAIVPTTKVDDATRAKWNQALSAAAKDHGDRVIDPSSVLQRPADYADEVHPNNRGHEDMAEYWNDAIGPLTI